MISNLKAKVGSGGFDPQRAELAQMELDKQISKDGVKWLETDINNLIEAWPGETVCGEEAANVLRKTVEIAIDLKCLAQSLGYNSLEAIAESLHSFGGMADPDDKIAMKLVNLHIEGIRAMSALPSWGRDEEAMANAIIENLRAGAKKITQNK